MNFFFVVQWSLHIDVHDFLLKQGFSTLALEVHFPAEFRSSPNQTYLNKLIEVFMIIRKLLAGKFDHGWS